MRKALALLLCFAFTGFAGAEIVNFDQGIDTKEIIHHYYDGYNDYYTPNVPMPMGHSRYVRDCVRFSFGPSDNDILSEKVRLHSTEYVEHCFTIMQPNGPDHITGPVTHCYEVPGQSWRKGAQISIKARKLFPWEKENFEVCLEGPWMRLYTNNTAYEYNINRIGHYDVLFELTPEYKKPMNPDLNGVQLVDFKYNEATQEYTLKVKDIWAKEYTGEKIMFKVELYKDGWWFFNSYLGKKEITFDSADTYEITFAENALETSVDEGIEADFKGIEIIRGAKKYYAKWGFKRIGSISKDKFMKKGETPKITK
ncbi:MAG: hypothetical protein L6420_03510 [Elusimicrobia bacterium]|nr:hypothetical protein [Candidatus Omnitrophota bacterium]MCG2725320.1 hypothetical protein [Elusimicrobiota bacterium]